ncbi:MAG: DNA polymerase III subunit delta [Acidobacteria bacterium]|jgi:DNA polymerase-3 subunit delta|nr:DNA polymerase III subunit delta [Acidobacteriota bacterium]
MARAPIQAIVGTDTYLAEEALERILEAAVGEDREDSLQVVYGDETTWERLVAVAQTGSLFVTRRAIVVRRADQLKGDEERIGAYAEDPAPGVTLVLMAAKPDRRRKVWKQLLARARTHSAQPKRGRALRAYVEEELRKRGLRIAPEGIEELIDRVGQDLRRLMGEVDKLEAYGAGQRSLSAVDVAAVLGRGLGRPLYLLGDAIAAREARTSLELIDELMGEGEEGLRILATLHRSLRQVRGALAMREAGIAGAEIGRKLLPANMQFKARALVDASRRWADADLQEAFVALGRADRSIKRGADAETTLAVAVVAACRGGEGGAKPSPRRGR